jgi:hypothetical protein
MSVLSPFDHPRSRFCKVLRVKPADVAASSSGRLRISAVAAGKSVRVRGSGIFLPIVDDEGGNFFCRWRLALADVPIPIL